MNFFQLIRILWARRLLIAGITAACFLAAAVVAFQLPTVYRATSRVVLDVIKPDPVTNEVLNSSFARAFAQTQVELIADVGVATRAVDILGWAKDPYFQQEYASNQEEGDGGFKNWLNQLVMGGASAELIEGTNILVINYDSSSPEQARVVADALREGFIEESIAQRRDAAQRNAKWFSTQADRIRKEVTALEKRKTDFERANNIVLQSDYSDTENERLKALAATPPPITFGGGAVVGGSPSAAQLAQLDAQIVAQGSVLGPNHPDLMALKQQRAGLASAAARESAAAAAAARGSGGGPSIASQVAQSQSKVLAQRDKIEHLRQLQTQIEVMREQYGKTEGRVAELEQQAQARESGVSTMGPATAPDTPASPKLALILIGAFVGGLGLGLLTSLVLELLSRRVRSADDLSSLSVPVLGIIMGDPEDTRAGRAASTGT